MTESIRIELVVSDNQSRDVRETFMDISNFSLEELNDYLIAVKDRIMERVTLWRENDSPST